MAVNEEEAGGARQGQSSAADIIGLAGVELISRLRCMKMAGKYNCTCTHSDSGERGHGGRRFFGASKHKNSKIQN